MANNIDRGPGMALPALDGKIGIAAADLELSSPGYLSTVRAAAASLRRREADPGDTRAALEELEELAAIDVDAPTLARRPEVQLVKRSVRTLVRWYLRYVTQQVTAFAEGTVRFGWAITERLDALERSGQAGRRDLEALRGRVERLEAAAAPGGAPAAAAPGGAPAADAPGGAPAAGR